VGYTFLPKLGLTVTLGGRLEGAPPNDLIGSSGGRRRPGYAVSIEPGIVFIKIVGLPHSARRWRFIATAKTTPPERQGMLRLQIS
jgi:hypothetical protein